MSGVSVVLLRLVTPMHFRHSEIASSPDVH
jgi:hypothetical protein